MTGARNDLALKKGVHNFSDLCLKSLCSATQNCRNQFILPDLSYY